jgi:hypothetical protein
VACDVMRSGREDEEEEEKEEEESIDTEKV